MGYPVPKELRGEETIYYIKSLNLHIYRKHLLYNGPVTLIALAIGKIIDSYPVILGLTIALNALVYPLGNGKISNRKFDNGGMNYDKYLFGLLRWKLRGGGNIYISHKKEG